MCTEKEKTKLIEVPESCEPIDSVELLEIIASVAYRSYLLGLNRDTAQPLFEYTRGLKYKEASKLFFEALQVIMKAENSGYINLNIDNPVDAVVNEVLIGQELIRERVEEAEANKSK